MRLPILAAFLLASVPAWAQMGLPLAPVCSAGSGGCSTTNLSAFTASPSSGTLTIGQTVTITMHAAVPLTVTGTPPTLSLNDGGTATYVSGSGSNALVFTHTVQSGQNANPLAITAINPGS